MERRDEVRLILKTDGPDWDSSADSARGRIVEIVTEFVRRAIGLVMLLSCLCCASCELVRGLGWRCAGSRWDGNISKLSNCAVVLVSAKPASSRAPRPSAISSVLRCEIEKSLSKYIFVRYLLMRSG